MGNTAAVAAKVVVEMPKGGLGKGLGDLGRQADPFSSGAFNSVGTVFRPRGDDQLVIDGVEYRFVPDIIYGDRALAKAGQHGTVYKVTDGISQYALKVFRPEFRSAAAGSLAVHSLSLMIPGLLACRRTLLEAPRHDLLLRQCPELRWAALLPWIEGPTWGDVLRERRPLTAVESLSLAKGLVQVLARLEEHGMAHGHLSADNVMLPSLACPKGEKGGEPLELVDLEHLCLPGPVRVEILADWAPSYAHRTSRVPAENAISDRFAGALILSEILGWCDLGVREAAYGAGGYFDPSELQADCRRFDILQDALSKKWGGSVATAFQRAWRSRSLIDCPSLGEWRGILPSTAGSFELSRALEHQVSWRMGSRRIPAFAGAWLTSAAVVVVTVGIIGLPIALWSGIATHAASRQANRPAILQSIPAKENPFFLGLRGDLPAAAVASQTVGTLNPYPPNPEPIALKTGTVSRDLAELDRGGGRKGHSPNLPDGGCDGLATYSVGGRVVDDMGRGIPGVTFMASSGHSAVVSDESGSWRLEGLTGTTSLVPTKEGWVFTPVVTRVSGSAELLITGRVRAAVQPEVAGDGSTGTIKAADGVLAIAELPEPISGPEPSDRPDPEWEQSVKATEMSGIRE